MSFKDYTSLLFGSGVDATCYNKKFVLTLKSLIETSPQQFLDFLKFNCPKPSLSVIQFRIICLLLNYAVSACYKVSDFKSINSFYALSAVLGNNNCIVAKYFFAKSPIWISDRLWIDTLMISLSRDVCRWKVLRYLGTARKSTWNSLSLHHLNSNEVLAVLVISRIQAYAISMRSLGLTMDKICEIIGILVDRLELNKFALNWKVFPSRLFTVSVLDSVISAKVTQEERYLLHQSVDNSADNRELLGYSALIEVLLSIEAIHALRQCSTNSFSTSTAHMSKSFKQSFCLCGHNGTPWAVVGLENVLVTDAITTDRPAIVSSLCEKCYRLLLSNPLNVEVDMTYCGGICPIYYTPENSNASTTSGFVSALDFSSVYSVHDAILFVDSSAAMNSSPKAHPNNLQDFSATVLNVVPTCSLNECGLPSCLLQEYQKIQSILDSTSAKQQSVASSNRLSAGSNTSTSSKTVDTLSELPSVPHSVPPSPSSQVDLGKFIVEFWKGLTVNIVYAGSPTIEKTRVVYFRTSNSQSNDEIDSIINSSAALNTKLKNVILDSIQKQSLYLCWARRSDKNNLQYVADKSIDMDTIKHVKVGSNKWKQCINISGDVKTMVIKIVDEEVFQRVLNGLLSIVAFRGKQLS